MRILPVVALALAACGSGPKTPTLPEEKPRELGPEEIGPVPPEVRHAETDAYTVDVDGPPTALVKQQVQAMVTVRAKPGLFISTAEEWKLEAKAPSDVDVLPPVKSPTPAAVKTAVSSITYLVTVVPLRAGVRHITFKLMGSVCDDNFCDVVGDLVSWNLEVK